MALLIADIVIILREGLLTVGGVIIDMCINYLYFEYSDLPSSNKVVCLSVSFWQNHPIDRLSLQIVNALAIHSPKLGDFLC